MMTASEVARRTNLSKSTIYRKAKNGEIPCYRLGSSVRFKLKEVEKAMKGEKKCKKKQNEEPKQPRTLILTKREN